MIDDALARPDPAIRGSWPPVPETRVLREPSWRRPSRAPCAGEPPAADAPWHVLLDPAASRDGSPAGATAFRRRAVERKSVLGAQDELCTRCWIVVTGELAMQTIGFDGQVGQIASFGPGELAGAFPRPRRLHGDLVAVSECEVFEVATLQLAALTTSDSAIGAAVTAMIARQHDQLVGRMARRLRLSAVARVYAELLELAGPDGRIVPPPVLAALAVKVNTTRETASRAVTAAERCGLLERGDGELRIVSLDRLAEFVI